MLLQIDDPVKGREGNVCSEVQDGFVDYEVDFGSTPDFATQDMNQSTPLYYLHSRRALPL